MNGHQIMGRWIQCKGKAKRAWGRFTDNSVNIIDAECKILIGEIRERYGVALEATPVKAIAGESSI